MDIDGTKAARRPGVKRSTDGIEMPRVSRNLRLAGRTVMPQAAVPDPTVPVTPVADEHKRFPLPRYQAPERPRRIVRKRFSRRTGMVLRIAGALMLVLLTTGGFLSWKAYQKIHKVFHGTTTVAALASKPVVPSLLNGEGDGRVNILLLGIGGPGHDGPDLTDTIVLLSVDPVNDTATMLSVPRDLWVKQPVPYFGAEQKVNAAYESGKYHYLGHLDSSSANASAVEAGFASIDQVMKAVFDVHINYHMLVNFQAFRQAIDTVGGVTVDVPTPLVDPTMAWENSWNPVLAPAGVQQMNGKQALLYARSRETTSDFARGQRQRQILLALKDKVLTAGTLSNPTKIDELMNAFGDNVYSDLSTQGATRLYGITKKVSDSQIGSIGLTDQPHPLVTTDHVGTTSVDRPIAGFNNYTAIQAYVRSQLPDGYIVKENAPVAVVGTALANADAATALLKSYGYNVVSTTVATQAVPTSGLVDLSHGGAPFTEHFLETRYSTKPLTALPVGLNLPVGTMPKFVVMVSK